jgi:uncharacterized protein (DUF983 family)
MNEKRNAVKKGQWMVRLDDRTTIWHFACPFCGHGYSARTFIKKDSCSHCGADMKESK